MGAGHGTAGIGFKYGKMKGLKISPPQSVARIDHTSFLCERSFRILLPTYPPSALSYRPPPSVPPRPCHPPLVRPPTFPSAASLSFSELLPRRPFTLSSISAGSQHAILQVTHPPRWYVRAFSSVCRPPWRDVAFTRFSRKLC